MAQFIVRNLEEEVKKRLKRRAARSGRSMEEEVRHILRDAVKQEYRASTGLGTRIAALFAGHGLTEPIRELRGQAPRPAKFRK
jgi:antitoxin FitA